MDCIIKGTKTIQEFKDIRASKKLHRGLNGINLIKGVHFAHPFFYCLQVKNAQVY